MQYKNTISGRIIPQDVFDTLTAREQRSFITVPDETVQTIPDTLDSLGKEAAQEPEGEFKPEDFTKGHEVED
jgi:hypothetical protein